MTGGARDNSTHGALHLIKLAGNIGKGRGITAKKETTRMAVDVLMDTLKIIQGDRLSTRAIKECPTGSEMPVDTTRASNIMASAVQGIIRHNQEATVPVTKVVGDNTGSKPITTRAVNTLAVGDNGEDLTVILAGESHIRGIHTKEGTDRIIDHHENRLE